MDLETFLLWEKNALREEKDRLKKIHNEQKTSECSFSDSKEIVGQATSSEKTKRAAEKASSMTTEGGTEENSNILTTLEGSPVLLSSETFSLQTHCTAEHENKNVATGEMLESPLSKNVKEIVNKKTVLAHNEQNVALRRSDESVLNGNNKKKNKDDMEQWVTDTFYSYFPGFNDELQRRQRYLRERQQENQQNFLKHQLTHPPLPRNALHKSRQLENSSQAVNTARSSTSTTSNSNATMSHPSDKTDLQIIVNNPGYVPSKQHSSRPNTTRNKLLQDLTHTDLSPIGGGDGVKERNQRNAELESARKKDYQRDLMEQIEEKRRSIEVLREKDRRQDEALTRRLQEQLKTIQLEEQLEKEKVRADKILFDSEQNRLMREHLLAKLENDTKVLHAKSRDNGKDQKSNSQTVPSRNAEKVATGTTADVADLQDADSNKVYKYFSNSARHEYRRGRPLPEELKLDIDVSALNDERDDGELECFHLSEKVCPMCDGPLKNYESCCLRCQKKLSLRLKMQHNLGCADNNSVNENQKFSKHEDNSEESYSMVCEKCERLYGLCPTCVAQSDVCRACHRKRNVCLNCRRTLCTRCLDEIATGRDTERTHANEFDDAKHPSSFRKNDGASLQSFQILELNCGAAPDSDNNANYNFISPRRSGIDPDAMDSSASMESPQRLPYSMNIEKNSIFQPDYNTTKIPTSFERLDKIPSDDQFNIERVRKETDNRLSRYLRNYGDLAVNTRLRSKSESGQDRSTQTTPNTAARRDVVMNEEYNLSMPLLREMPKMTRLESNRMALRKPAHLISNRIEQLKRRWEIPAVQKFIISSTSPKVLTQVGAIRKQLQAEHFLGDFLEENG